MTVHVAAGSPVRQMSLHIAPFERKRIAIVFADLSDFVSFTEREGDTVAAQLLLLNVLTATPIANCRGGRVVKHLGDGFLAWFPDPAQAVLASVELARAGSDILPMRIGAHWGHAVVTPHDVIGGTVNLAARPRSRGARRGARDGCAAARRGRPRRSVLREAENGPREGDSRAVLRVCRVVGYLRGGIMSRNLERTFSVAMPVERVWSAMTDPDELNRWYFPFRVAEDGSTRTEILGVERQAEVVAYEPPRRFCLRTTYTGLEQWPPLPPGTQGDDRRAGSHGLGNASS